MARVILCNEPEKVSLLNKVLEQIGVINKIISDSGVYYLPPEQYHLVADLSLIQVFSRIENVVKTISEDYRIIVYGRNSSIWTPNFEKEK